MSFIRIILLCLIPIVFLCANPFSIDVSLSGGPMNVNTNYNLFNNNIGIEELIDSTYISNIWKSSFKTKLSCYYKNTGIYTSVDKPIDFNKLKRYWILSGGLVQRINLTENSSMDIRVGITWHSVNEAIHSFMNFIVYTHYKAVPGLDFGVSYNHTVSKTMSLFAEANYSYNKFYNGFYDIHYTQIYYSKIISLNAGIVFSLKQRHSDQAN